MELALASFARSLPPEGRIVMVVGRESRIRRVPFCNSGIIQDLFHSTGCFEVVGSHERAFTNRFGTEIKEDIVICTRLDREPATGCAREIAVSHLEHAMAFADQTVKRDINDAVSQCMNIEPSPLFQIKEAL